MNYWHAKGYHNTAIEFEKLMNEYWSKLPEQRRHLGIDKLRYNDNDESYSVRMKISHLLPLIEEAAATLGISYIVYSCPAPADGGPVLPVNIFRSVIDPEIGHTILDRKLIVDTVVRTKVIAQRRYQIQLIHMLLPWNWVIDICAFVIRIPFIILRRAGLPAKVEENIISHAIKIMGTIILVTYLAYKGVSLASVNLSEFINSLLK